MITPKESLECGEGVIKTINISTVLDVTSVQTMFCALVTMGLVRKAADPYAVYQGYFNDVVALFTGQVGTVPSRLRYLNRILGSVVPKSIPFRDDGVINYTYKNLQISLPGSTIAIRSKNYYMFIPSLASVNGYQLQVAPPVYSDQLILNAYLNSMQMLSSKSKHCEVLRNVDLEKAFLRDASSFGRYSSYFGNGGGVGTFYGSAEFEVPVKSPMLAVLQQFDPSYPRAARNFEKCAGDACCNYGIGALDAFNTKFYQGAIPPIIKCLDLYELCLMLAVCMRAAIIDKLNNPPNASIGARLDNGMSMTWRQFQLMVRKQIDWMFADSAPLVQFFAANTTNGPWEAFRQGSNCFPKQPGTIMKLPVVINENLKGLRMCIRPYATKNYNSTRNHITHIPAWGQFKNYVETPFTYQNSQGNPVNLFAPDDPQTPDLWDGSLGNQVVDLNCNKVNSFCLEWNDFMQFTDTSWTSVDSLGGSSKNSPFLQFTRHVEWFQAQEDLVISDSYMPEYMRDFVKEETIKIPRKQTLSRAESFDTKKIRTVGSPQGATLVNQATVAMTGIIPITQTHLEYLNLLILPVMEIVPDTVPSVVQIQTAYMEPYKYEKDSQSVFSSRFVEIQALLRETVCGQAGKETALDNFINKLIESNNGAFIGDLFSFLGNTANSIGIPIAGPLLQGVGGALNSIGV